MKAMVFAAGLGTRLKPLTDKMPKALVPIAGKPLLYHVMNKLRAAGYNLHSLARVKLEDDGSIDFLPDE